MLDDSQEKIEKLLQVRDADGSPHWIDPTKTALGFQYGEDEENYVGRAEISRKGFFRRPHLVAGDFSIPLKRQLGNSSRPEQRYIPDGIIVYKSKKDRRQP